MNKTEANRKARKKKCTKCQSKKALREFHKDSSTKDGYYPSCKLCRGVKVPLLDRKYKLDNQGYMKLRGERQHRTIMEKHQKRKLKKSEHVHHIDSNKQNNCIENLQIVSNSEHLKIHRNEIKKDSLQRTHNNFMRGIR